MCLTPCSTNKNMLCHLKYLPKFLCFSHIILNHSLHYTAIPLFPSIIIVSTPLFLFFHYHHHRITKSDKKINKIISLHSCLPFPITNKTKHLIVSKPGNFNKKNCFLFSITLIQSHQDFLN